MSGADDILLGRTEQGQNFFYSGEMHMASFAGTGGGKTTGSVIPNALRWGGSLIIIDPKADTANLSCHYRAETLDQDVFLLDPFQICDETLSEYRASYNPMDEIDASPTHFDPDAVSKAKRLASALVFKAEGDNRYFSNQAINFLKAVFLHVKTAPYFKGETHLLTVADQLSNIDKLIEAMMANVGAEDKPGDLSGIVARVGRQMKNKASREKSSIVSVSQEGLEILDNPMMAHALGHTKPGLDFSAMRTRPQTYYLILPFEYLEDYSRWLRLMVTNILGAFMAMPEARDEAGMKIPALFVLDEFANLGSEMDIITTAFSYVRSKNVRLHVLLQELSILQALYKNTWEGILANCGLIEGFAINSLTTSEYLSKLSGTRLVEHENPTAGTSISQQGLSISDSEGITLRDEPFMKPQDVRWQRRSTKFIFTTGRVQSDVLKPTYERVQQVPWFREESLIARVPEKYRP